jgi:predicted nucleic acid-binding protein
MGTVTPKRIYFDTNCFIYTVEQVPPFFDSLVPLWQSATSGKTQIITSELAFMEVLVKPLQTRDILVEAAYRQILTQSQEVRMEPISLIILEQAARLRTSAGLKGPDAIHAATALVTQCTELYTNDIGFRRVPGLHVILINQLTHP